jgi:hypothetical protein
MVAFYHLPGAAISFRVPSIWIINMFRVAVSDNGIKNVAKGQKCQFADAELGSAIPLASIAISQIKPD